MANTLTGASVNKYERCQLKPEGKECVAGPQGHADCCIPYEPWNADAYYRFVTKADHRWNVLATICRELHFDYEDGPEKAVETIRAVMAKIEEQKAELLDSAATVRQLTRMHEQQADSVREVHAANEELCCKLAASRNAVTATHADNESITAMNKELAGKVADLREELEHAIRTGYTYAKEVNQLRVDLVRAENNGVAVACRAGKQAEQTAELHSKLEHVRDNRDALRSTCIQVANERNDLQKKLDLAEAKLIMASRLEENLRTMNAEQARRIEAGQREIESLNTRLDHAGAEILKLKAQEAPVVYQMPAEFSGKVLAALEAAKTAEAEPENIPYDSLHRVTFYNAEGLRCTSYLPNAPAPLLEHIRPVVVSTTLVDVRTREQLEYARVGGQQKPATVNNPEAVVGTVQFERAGRVLEESVVLCDDVLEPGPDPINTFSQPGYEVGQRCNRNSCHGIITLSYGLRKCPVCCWML